MIYDIVIRRADGTRTEIASHTRASIEYILNEEFAQLEPGDTLTVQVFASNDDYLIAKLSELEE